MGFQGKTHTIDQMIAALQRYHVGYLPKKDNKNIVNIIVKNNETAEYTCRFIRGQLEYRSHTTKVLSARNQINTYFHMEIQ